ncbi:alpha/beta fold hydrolase [Streptomyces sp. NPDC052023]|uniref:alpha/beta fold hydrolase n=1 Tax=Streptomyces sp. NPDC052023 TaxID=3365681 RepID=UPI0037D75FC5
MVEQSQHLAEYAHTRPHVGVRQVAPDIAQHEVLAGDDGGDRLPARLREPEYQAEQARALAAGDVEAWLGAFLRVVPGPHRTAADVDPDIPRRLREMALATISQHTPGEKNWHVPVTGTWDRVANSGVPVLTVNGGLEPADLRAAAERLAGTVANGRSVTIEGTGHYPNLEQPRVFDETLLGFLRGL